MASLPPRPASQRRPSPRDDSASSQQEQPARASSFSATSEDSHVLLGSPRSSSPQPAERTHDRIKKTTEVTVTSSAADEDTEPRRCWICFNDETEDDETTSEWRSPCPCVLVAHEKCLLDWIADMEAPNSRRRAGGREGRILCPQCKSEIKLQRPRSIIVDTVRVAERLTGMFLLPGVAAFAGTAAYTTLALIGRAQIYQIFGTEDGYQILAPLYQAPNVQHGSMAVRLLHDLHDHWRLHLGLPLIPTVLMASRTTSFFDSFLPFLPLIFFVNSNTSQQDMLQFSWPPSAAFTVATLPYLRGIYTAYYERVWLPREQKWLKEIQPRAGSEPEPEAARGLEIQIGNDGEEEGDIIEDALEVEVDFDILHDWNNGGGADNNNAPENPPVPIARGPAPPIDAPPQDDDEPPQLININDDAAPAPNVPQQLQPPRRQRIRRERNIAFSTTNLADTILGALVFPSIAAAVGEALRYALPRSWVTAPTTGKPTGLLQARWGRSIIGGCLFVGVKDAVLLYVRWRMAQNHRKRRVLDYEGSKGGKGRRAATGSAR